MLAELGTEAGACFAPRRLGHVNLWCGDLAASERFYNKACGLRVEFTEPGLKASFLGTGHTPHDLGLIEVTCGTARLGRDGQVQLAADAGPAAGLNHLAWEVENEKVLVEGFKRLRDMDFRIGFTADHQVAHSVYVEDPDGNRNEFYADTVKDWRSRFSGEMDLITSFWDPLSAEGFTDGRYDDAPVLNPRGEGDVYPWRVTHAVLRTARLEEMERFYTAVGGLQVAARHLVAGRWVVYLKAALPAYDHALVLVEAPQAGFVRSTFQLRTEADLEAGLAALRKNGHRLEAEVDRPWKRAVFLSDPDGLGCEFYVRRPAPPAFAGAGDAPLEHLV